MRKQYQKFTKSALNLLNIIYSLIQKSPSKPVYLTLEFLCTSLGITDRQLRTLRKEISNIFFSKWRKATKINGVLKKNVYVFSYTASGRELLGNQIKDYKSIKLGSLLPTSIYKDENNFNNGINEYSSWEEMCCKLYQELEEEGYKVEQHD